MITNTIKMAVIIILLISFFPFSISAEEVEVLVDLKKTYKDAIILHDCAFDGDNLYVLYVNQDKNGERHIVKINPDTGEIREDIVIEHMGCMGPCLSYDGEHLIIVIDDQIFKLDKDFKVLEESKVPLLFGAVQGISYDDGKIWVVHNTERDEITLLDLDDKKSEFQFYAPTQIPVGLAMADGYLWLSDPENIYQIDPVSGEVVKTIEAHKLGISGFRGLAYRDGVLFVLTQETKIVYKLWI